MQNLRIAILGVALDFQVIFANRQAAGLLRYSVAQLREKSVWDLLDAACHDRLRVCLDELGRGKELAHYCAGLVFVAAGGQTCMTEVWLLSGRDTDDLVYFYIQDVTERARMMQELDDARCYLQSVITDSADGMMVIDQDGQIGLVNPALIEMLPVSLRGESISGDGVCPVGSALSGLGQMSGHSVDDFFPGLWDWLMTFESGGSGDEPALAPSDDLRLSRFLHWFEQDRQERCLEIGVSRLSPGIRGTGRWIAVVRDVTEHKRAEKTLLTLSDVAVNMQRALTPQDVFQTVIEHLSKLGFKLIIVREQEDNRLHITGASFSPRELEMLEKLLGMPLADISFPIDHVDYYRTLVRTQRAILIANGGEFLQSLFPRRYVHVSARVVSLLGIGNVVISPFMVDEQVKGAFFVAASHLTQTDVSAISAFTAQFNIAWETARLYQRARAYTADLETAVAERTRELEAAINELLVKEQTQRNISSELSRANRALRAEKQRTEAILHSVADGLIVVDETMRVTLVNPAAEMMLGVSRQELLDTFLPEARHVNVCRFFYRVFEGDSRPDTVEFDLVKWEGRAADSCCQGVRRDGDEAPKCWLTGNACVRAAGDWKEIADCPVYNDLEAMTVQAHRSAIVDERDQIVGTVVALSDITRLKEVERLKSQFVSSVSHELRTPLTNIKLYLSLLKDGRREKRDRYLEIVTTEADRLERLIQDVLDLSRLDAVYAQVSRERISMPGLVERVVEAHLPRAEGKNIKLDAALSLGLPPFLGNADHFIQILTNLLSNAVQYTLPGGRVQVGISYFHDGQWATGDHPLIDDVPAGEWGVLWVSDTGIGIMPEEQPHIYERFYRGSLGEPGMSGTGLGLSIVNQIVQLYDGHILLQSQEGVGSTFTVLLPVLESTVTQPQILLVDDDVTISNLVTRFLAKLECQVEWVADGAQGFARASASAPDLMILDLNLPGMDGMTILSLLSALPSTKEMPILVLTGRSDVTEFQIRRLGADAFLSKPFSAAELTGIVSELLSLEEK